MASSPEWKIYRNGNYVACCKHAEDAAALVSLSGGIVKNGHTLIVWKEGAEAFSAGESYDGAAEIMHSRLRSANIKAVVKHRGVAVAIEWGATAEEIKSNGFAA